MKKDKFAIKVGRFDTDKIRNAGTIVEISKDDEDDIEEVKSMIRDIIKDERDIKKIEEKIRKIIRRKEYIKGARDLIRGIIEDKKDIKTVEEKIKNIVRSRQKYASIFFPWEKIENIYKCKEKRKSIPRIIEDFLVIALSTFYVDQRPERYYGFKKKESENFYFSRNIQITIPVFEIRKWNEVGKLLEKTIAFITFDNINYNFIEREDERKEAFLRENQRDIHSVSLLSGGLDSLGGYFHLKDNKPIYVSIGHGSVRNIIENLFGEDIEEKNIVIYDYKEENPQKEKKKYEKHDVKHQFSRSFLYLTCAAVTALAFRDAKTIYIPENGIIARNIGLGESRFSTRTAHPRFLSYYQSLLERLFPDENLDLVNPFTLKTKGEIVGIIRGKKIKVVKTTKENRKKVKQISIKGEKELIKETVSCSHSYAYGHKNCGLCVPCLYRKISVISNFLEEGNTKEGLVGIYPELGVQGIATESDYINYSRKVELFFEESQKDTIKWQKRIQNWYKDGIVNVYDLLRFVSELKRLPARELKIKYPELLDDDVFCLYQRFVEESMKVFCYFSNRNEELKRIIDQMTEKDLAVGG